MNESPKVPETPSAPSVPLSGLTSEEAAKRLAHYGPNAVAEEKPHPLLAFLGTFWATVPWMLEATDVAKAPASSVLTAPGLGNIVDAVQTSRRVYQRMLTYTLNIIITTFQIALFLSLGLVVSKVFVLTPMLIILLLFANDFITMSITTDRVTFAKMPDRWAIRPMMIAASALALPLLAFSFGLVYAASVWMHLPLPQVQTLMFVMLALTGQGTVYLVRERRHFWRSVPSGWMLGSTALDVAAVCAMAVLGILIAAVPWTLAVLTLGATLVFLVLLDFLKIPTLAYCTGTVGEDP